METRPGSLARSRQLVAVTYNIHRCTGPDGQHHPERVLGVLQELRPDVVGLQEVDTRLSAPDGQDQLGYLACGIGMHAIAGHTVFHGDRFYGNAVLSRLPVAAVRFIDLSVRHAEPRSALDVDLQVCSGVCVRVVVVHLGLRARERRAQVRRLLAVVCAEERSLTLLLGDFNEWLPVSRTVQQLHGRYGTHVAQRTYPAKFPLFGLDRIWVNPAEMLGEVRAHRSALARVASDHLPLAARLLLRLPPAPSCGAKRLACEEDASLGSAVCHGNQREHGGWLGGEGEPGQGSCFTVCLPQGESHEQTDSGGRRRPEHV